tara:strand:+ start:98 stop:448 length:351 start_codon:yes stop_codon:yes gene_type:complete
MIKYFAKLGLSSKVEAIHLVNENDAPTEEAGKAFLNKQTGYPFWVETFKDRSKRKNYARIGHTYDEDKDAFIPKQPFNSWILNETTCQWESPVAYPDDGKEYKWNESTKSWDEKVS